MGAMLVHLNLSESLISLSCGGESISSNNKNSLLMLSLTCEYFENISLSKTLVSFCLHPLMMVDQAL